MTDNPAGRPSVDVLPGDRVSADGLSADGLSGISIDRLADRSRSGGGDVFAKAYNFTLIEEAKAAQVYPFYQPITQSDGPVVQIYGQSALMLGSNNYLGLTRHPDVMAAAAAAIRQFGTSMTGSRTLNGTMDLHVRLEERLAGFLGKEACLVFTTGYQANLGAISALVSRDCAAVIDRDCHASIYDGCRLSDGKLLRFRHNDAAHLESTLAAANGKPALVIVDGVYSMSGAVADLPGIAAVCRRHNARLMVDDAHAIGVLGPGGRGTGSHFALEDDVDLTIGTFSKSLASIGGFVAGPYPVVEWIRHFARSMVFSASLPPAAAAAALAAVETLERDPGIVQQSRALSRKLRCGLNRLGFASPDSESAIVPVTVGDEVQTIRFWRSLLERGVYVNPVTYPAVTKGRSMLRVSCMATHTPAQIDYALEQFAAVGQEHGII